MFKGNEIFYRDVLGAVTDCAGMEEQRILHGRDEESSDVRVALVKLLAERMTDTQISLLMGITRRGIHYIRSSYEAKRGKWVVRSIVEAVGKRMGSNPLQGK